MAGPRADQEWVETLRSVFSGRILTPDDEGYDEARRVWNGMIDRRPGAVALAHDESDVAAAVRVARKYALTLAVRGGGHNVAGLATAADGLVLDLSGMNAVRVDPDARLVYVQGGALWRDVDAATQEYGLATPSGLVSETGVGGLTLGGGMGWLRRKYGLSCDNLVAADLVTASGDRIHTDEREHGDLLWALRGGGGNFGVVTTFVFRLHPVGPDVSFALVLYDAAETRQVLARFRDVVSAAPEEIAPLAFTGFVAEGTEGVAPGLYGRPMVAVAAVDPGPSDEADERLAPLRRLGTRLADLSDRLPYVNAQRFLDEEYPRGRRYYWKSAALEDLSEGAIDVIAEFSRRMPSPLSTIDVWPMGGASGREPAGGSAYAGRSAAFYANPEANWDDPSRDDQNVRWARELLRALKPYTVGTYLNFPGFLEEGERQLRASFGAHYERLVVVKNTWDPGNLFRLNHNIPPDLGTRAA
jgi:FAD/FMN-containing dehydrogenase